MRPEGASPLNENLRPTIIRYLRGLVRKSYGLAVLNVFTHKIPAYCM